MVFEIISLYKKHPDAVVFEIISLYKKHPDAVVFEIIRTKIITVPYILPDNSVYKINKIFPNIYLS